MKTYRFWQYPRGANKGGLLKTEICPTISKSSWENNCLLIEIEDINKMIENKVIIEGNYNKSNHNANRWLLKESPRPLWKNHGTVTAIIDPQVLTPKRTEYGKAVRNLYESGKIKESRHNMTELKPSGDGISNTLTSVQKDNMVIEPIIYDDYNDQNTMGTLTTNIGNDAPRNGYKIIEKNMETKEDELNKVCREVDASIEYKGRKIEENSGLYTGTSDKFFRGGLPNMSRILKAEKHDAATVQNYRIRKLTPRECFRLMGVSEEDIDKIQNAGISNSQQYKLAGNSIVVDVMACIFRNLFLEEDNIKDTLF